MNEIIQDNISGSLNIGRTNNASVSFEKDINIGKYFSIATCYGYSHTCKDNNLRASANVDSVTVGASVTIIGDAAKGMLKIDKEGNLYTQQLWVSGNDNDKSSDNPNDSSNGMLIINNKSKVFVVSSQENTPFKNNEIKWNQEIISKNNNISDDTVNSGDLVLGKTGNGVIVVNNHSELNVMNNVIVSTGVTGAPNYNPSEIYINNGSDFYIGGDMRGGVSASGKLYLTMDKESSMDVNGNVSVGIGSNSEVTVGMSDKSVMLVGRDFSIATGAYSTAIVTIDNSELSVAGSSSIGGGDSSSTIASLINGATISGSKDIKIAEGGETCAKMTINNSSLTTEGALSIGSGDNTKVIMTGEGALVTSRGQLLAAKGEKATAKLDYTNSKLSTGSVVIASGSNASANVKLEQSSFTSNGDMIIGQGTGSSSTMESKNSLISAQGNYVAAQGEKATASLKYNNTDITVGGAVLGAGESAKATLDFNNSRLISSGGVVIGDGQNAVAELNLSDGSVFKGERINIGNGISSQNTITVTGGSVFDFGNSQNSAIGEGESSHSVVTVNNGYLYGDGSLTLAKGKNSSAELNLQDNAVSNANNISLATESGSRAIVNISNANSRQFNPVSMGAGDGYAEVNFDGINGYILSTNFLCMDSRACTDTVMNIRNGTVSLSGTNDWKGQINVYDGTRLDARGNDAVDGILNVSTEAQVDFNGYSQHMTGIDNKGMIYLSDGSASSDVYLDKDYVAHDGSGVQFGIFGQKEADVMHVNGDTSGSSGIVITTNSKNKIKKGGDILLVEVNGDSSGSFYFNSLIKNDKEYKVTGDYIDVGAWEYALNKKRKNWYLSVDMRPEPGAFINNSKSMLDMFALQRYDIPGQHRYPTLFENLYNNGMWIQFNNNSGSNSEVYDNLKTSYSLNTMMIGGDIYNWTDGYNYSHIGIMGGVGSAANKTASTNNKRATGNVEGYTLGLYHVFQQNISDGLNESERQGLWTYSSIQYMDYDNSVSSTNNFKADYGVNGFRLTGEVGYLKNIGGIQPSDFYVEPKLYLSHTELSGGVVEDLQGGKITYPNSLTIIEPGVFFSYRKTHESTSNDEAMFKDYIKQSVVDAWFGGGYSFKTGNYNRTNFDSDMVEYNTSDNFVLKSGVEFEFLKDARLLLSSSYSINNDRNLSFILGGNYYF
ncbi:autotransporter outer membrane beta-barrel domain-containing protein [Escherichia coli]|nr:autotransporter outer membrane beta-barrel domain-containing protein [Escherichia coli]EHR8682680.1 autotransporter outer membrane beta-barrel domain-containing protein [Escherichia coli]EHR8987424.1 autotransporter outer membrane beta-barrel domain-containing protein [Escherichia coli]EHR9219622.1 autotransporter outer membrane beta-barrel domain-containing protein [Escherichia coli]EIM2920772.1 autotransporter outer membrane beta-barrel domain-containing protein [Escherichia coli]